MNFGERIQQATQDLFGPFIFIIVFIGIVFGLWMVFRGIAKLVEFSGQDRPDGFTGPLLSILVGAAIIALPEAAGVGMSTFFESTVYAGNLDIRKAAVDLDDPSVMGLSSGLSSAASGLAEVGAVQNCLTAEKPVPCMANNIAVNVVPIGVIAIYLFAFVGGLWGLLQSLQALGQQRSPGERLPPGWLGKFVASILLMAVPQLFTYVSRTLFGNIDSTLNSGGLNSGSSLLRYTSGVSDALAPYEELMGSVFVILVLFGAFTFVKGVFILKSAGDGRSQQSMGTAVVFMLAGICLANFKQIGCLATTTVGFQAFNGLGFCT